MKGTLKTKRQFDLVYRQGRKAVGRYQVVFVLTAPPSKAPAMAYAVVASRKVGGAVARSRAKRLLREAMGRNRKSLPAASWIVLVARSPIVAPHVRADAVADELAGLLGRTALREPGASGAPWGSSLRADSEQTP